MHFRCPTLKHLHACEQCMMDSSLNSVCPGDMGKNFESKLFHELCQITGINKSRTTPFHPQCDGQTERMNRTLLQMLRCTADDNPATWPQRLPTVMAAYRMTVHRVTGLTPNMAMFGREVMLPATLIAKPPEEPSLPQYHLLKTFEMR